MVQSHSFNFRPFLFVYTFFYFYFSTIPVTVTVCSCLLISSIDFEPFDYALSPSGNIVVCQNKKMPPNSVIKTSFIVGGLTFLGYMAGGKLGSMFGAVIGTVVSALFDREEPMASSPEQPENRPLHRRRSPFYPPRPTKNTSRRRRISKSKDKSESHQSKCSICLEQFKPSILLLPCSHMCFCDDCYDKVKERKVSICPICRENIEEIMFVFPS